MRSASGRFRRQAVLLIVAALVVGLVAAGASHLLARPSTPTPTASQAPETPRTTPSALAVGPSYTPAPGGSPTTTPQPTPSPPPPTTPSPALVSVREFEVGAPPAGPSGCQSAFEPIVATDPLAAAHMALAYERDRSVAGRCDFVPALVISHDGGRSWQAATGVPWQGSGRYPDHHATIAWGPGPRPGKARLYWADATVGPAGGDHLLSVAWSDDDGRTWSPLYTERRTPPWVGGFPDITVDRDPASPDYGVVYVAYNWLASQVLGPGLRVLASGDFGRTWQAVEVPRAAAPAGYPASWRIAYRLRTGPDGALYVAFYQADLRAWDASHIFSKGGLGNVGRLGFAVAYLRFLRATRSFVTRPAVMVISLPRNAYTVNGRYAPGTSDNVYVDPMWQEGLDVDPSTGRVLLAVGEYGPQADPGLRRGAVLVGRSDDQGRSWAWTTVPALPPQDGHRVSSFRPSVVAIGGRVVVAFQGITDLPAGTSPALHLPTIENAVAVSWDDGRTFAPPTPVSSARWNAAALEVSIDGPGLRERADAAGPDQVIFVYGDGRLARPAPDARAGRSAIFGALIELPPAAVTGGGRLPERLTGRMS